MCGIWARFFFSVRQSSHHAMLEQASVLRQRGPDKTTVAMHPHFMMVFHRLAFHDLSPLGDQPMIYYEDDAVYHLMVNGEIYNHRELIERYRLELRSRSDCEVILPLYLALGENMERVLQKLDGEFVLILSKTTPRTGTEFLVARDPYGVRPLFYSQTRADDYTFSSLARDLCHHKDGTATIHPFPPGCLLHVAPNSPARRLYRYHHHNTIIPRSPNKTDICDLLIEAVAKRMSGERPMACLLSGGLDSSLICGILVRVLGVRNLHTFSIGMEGSADLAHARLVADHLATTHHEIIFTEDEGLAVIDEVIEACETWDITTIRASIGQFLLARHIATTTDFRAILNGDGADEAQMGYLYWHNAPSLEDAHEESLRRLDEIHLYDGLRVDRCLGRFGLEARLPYLDKAWVHAVLSLPAAERMPSAKRMEKHTIREAFATRYPGILPEEVLWRRKEAFSDGVSRPERSWFRTIQEWAAQRVSPEQLATDLGLPQSPPTAEAWYYQYRFLQLFHGAAVARPILSNYWLPRWSGGLSEPSARVLSVYPGEIIEEEEG